MIIRAIRLRDVRGFGEQGIAIESIENGLSVLAERNEFGKSTIFDAIRAALFYKHGSADKTVKSLAPHNGGAPLIELDLEFEGKLFRATKQFLKRARAEIRDLDASEIVARDGDAHDWLLAAIGSSKPGSGPSGLLWVEQGKSMELPSAGEDGGLLLSSLLENEIGQVTGGERARRILNDARERLSQIETKTGKPAGPYRDCARSRDSARDMVDEYASRVAETEAAQRELVDIDRQLKDLEDPEAAQETRAKIDAAQEALNAAQQASERLTGLLRARDDAQSMAEAATTAHERLVADQEEAIANSDDIEALEKEIAGLVEEEDTARREEQEKQNACETAERAVTDAEAVERTAIRSAEQKRAQKTLASAEENLAAAVAATTTIANITAQLRENLITEETLAEIEELARGAGVAQARIEALRPKLSVAIKPGGEGKVAIDGEVVHDGDERHLSGDVNIDIVEIATLSVSADDPSDAAAELEAAKGALQRALGAAAADDLRAAQRLMRARRELEVKLQRAEDDLDRVAPDGLTAVEAGIEDLRRKAGVAVECDVSLEKAAEDVANARAGLAEAQSQRTSAAQNRSKKREALSKSRGKLEPLTSRAAVLIEQLGGKAEWPANEEASRRSMEKAEAAANARALAYEEAAAQTPNLEAAAALLARLKQAEANRTEKIRTLTGRRGEVAQTLRHGEAEGIGEQLGEAAGRLSALEEKCLAYEADARALHLLIETLSSTQAALQDQFFKPVIAELNPLLAEVIPGAELKLDEKFQADALNREGNLEKFGILSGGTREQIAVLCRLAFAKLMVNKGKPSPVILDDALVFDDDQRLESMFTALTMAAQSGVQCLVFTCRQRAFGDLGGNALQWKPWPA